MPKVLYKNYLLFILVVVASVSYFDRFVFALALEPIKHDLKLTDSQLGLMTGFAFAALYALAGLPIARWADKANRINISSLSVGLAGISVFFCGLAGNFSQLLLARAFVAVGEAGAIPAAQSLISDHFDRAERPRAIAIYFMSYAISMVIGYLFGGWIVGLFGWRTAFMIIGLPCILAAIVARITLKDHRVVVASHRVERQPSIRSVSSTLWRQRTFRHILMAFCVSYFFFMGTSQWQAAFFIRTHNMSVTELGAWFALTVGVFGIFGNYVGGYFASAFAAKNEQLQFRLLAINMVVYGMSSMMIYLSPNKYVAISFLGFSAFIGNFTNGPLFAAIQSLVRPEIRAVTVAFVFLCANLIGFGLGPFAVGILSDALSSSFGSSSLRYALAIFCPGSIWIAYHFWKAASFIEEDIKITEQRDFEQAINHNKKSSITT